MKLPNTNNLEHRGHLHAHRKNIMTTTKLPDDKHPVYMYSTFRLNQPSHMEAVFAFDARSRGNLVLISGNGYQLALVTNSKAKTGKAYVTKCEGRSFQQAYIRCHVKPVSVHCSPYIDYIGTFVLILVSGGWHDKKPATMTALRGGLRSYLNYWPHLLAVSSIHHREAESGTDGCTVCPRSNPSSSDLGSG